MSRESRLVKKCIKIAKKAERKTGFAYCMCSKFGLECERYDLAELHRLANEAGYKFVGMTALPNWCNLPDAHEHLVLVTQDTLTI